MANQWIALRLWANPSLRERGLAQIELISFDEILAELPKLTAEQRDLLRVRLAALAGEEWMDADGLTPAEKVLIEERIAQHQRDPSSGISLKEIESCFRAKFGP